MTTPSGKHTITEDKIGLTLAAFLRSLLPDRSWKQVRRLIESRQAHVNDELCLDPARRLREGEVVEILARPAPKPKQHQNVVIRHLDEHLVVVEKPSGISTVRHPTERDWPRKRKELSPTLEDVVFKMVTRDGNRIQSEAPRLRIVHRLDKETSGLVVFARTVRAERGLGKQFRAHTVERKYHAIIPGFVKPQTIRSFLVRDRGDGRRGSTTLPNLGKEAITHVEVVERSRGFTLLQCRLETGRTHQIRIHLAELGHPICGEKVYRRPWNGELIEDKSDAPRLALHAVELGFSHPITEQTLAWSMEYPMDLEQFVQRLRMPRKSQ